MYRPVQLARKINDSEWAAPVFTKQKSDGSLRYLADLRELNKSHLQAKLLGLRLRMRKFITYV